MLTNYCIPSIKLSGSDGQLYCPYLPMQYTPNARSGRIFLEDVLKAPYKKPKTVARCKAHSDNGFLQCGCDHYKHI